MDGFHSAGGHLRVTTHQAAVSSATSATAITGIKVGCARNVSVTYFLRHMNPVLLRKFYENPDRCGRSDYELGRHPLRIPAKAHRFVEDEEIFERIREDQQNRPPMGELIEKDAHEPVIEEKPADLEGGEIVPVSHRGQVRDREVIDVERLVVRLIGTAGVQGRPALKDGLIDRVDDERSDDRRKGKAGDKERNDQPETDYDQKNDQISGVIEHRQPPPCTQLSLPSTFRTVAFQSMYRYRVNAR